MRKHESFLSYCNIIQIQEETFLLLPNFLAIVFCAAMAMMLISCVAFIQDNKFFSSAPLLVAGIGFLLEWILPLPFNGFASGFESLGWIGMFLGGIQAVKKDERMDNR